MDLHSQKLWEETEKFAKPEKKERLPDAVLEILSYVYMHVQKQTKKLSWKTCKVLIVYNVHLTVTLWFCVKT